MRKRDELSNPRSCLNRARDDEWLFVLLGRDVTAPATIRFWISERLRLEKNRSDDPQINDAAACAVRMEQERDLTAAAPAPDTPVMEFTTRRAESHEYDRSDRINGISIRGGYTVWIVSGFVGRVELPAMAKVTTCNENSSVVGVRFSSHYSYNAEQLAALNAYLSSGGFARAIRSDDAS